MIKYPIKYSNESLNFFPYVQLYRKIGHGMIKRSKVFKHNLTAEQKFDNYQMISRNKKYVPGIVGNITHIRSDFIIFLLNRETFYYAIFLFGSYIISA